MNRTFILILLICYYISFTTTEEIESEGVLESKENTIRGKRNNKHIDASLLAQKAAQEAKAAEDAQPQAGRKAAHQVEEELAEKACEAAHAADNALAGKKRLVEEIKADLNDAELVVSEESASLQQLQQTCQAATKAAQEAKGMLKLLTSALQLSQQDSKDSHITVDGLNAQVNEKEQLLEAAKCRCQQLHKQLQAAREDLGKTKEATKKAEQAAAEAKQAADRTRRRARKRHIRKV